MKRMIAPVICCVVLFAAFSSQQLVPDDLKINDPDFQSAIGIKIISEVMFSGVWDSELGLVSETAIKNYMDSHKNRTRSALLGALIGGCSPAAAAILSSCSRGGAILI